MIIDLKDNTILIVLLAVNIIFSIWDLIERRRLDRKVAELERECKRLKEYRSANKD